MDSKKTINKQSGFFDFGASLLLLAIFGGSAVLIKPDVSGSSYANQETKTDIISNAEAAIKSTSLQEE